MPHGTRMNPVEPERFDWVFLFLIFVILGIHFKSNGFLFMQSVGQHAYTKLLHFLYIFVII